MKLSKFILGREDHEDLGIDLMLIEIMLVGMFIKCVRIYRYVCIIYIFVNVCPSWHCI